MEHSRPECVDNIPIQICHRSFGPLNFRSHLIFQFNWIRSEVKDLGRTNASSENLTIQTGIRSNKREECTHSIKHTYRSSCNSQISILPTTLFFFGRIWCFCSTQTHLCMPKATCMTMSHRFFPSIGRCMTLCWVCAYVLCMWASAVSPKSSFEFSGNLSVCVI